MSQSADPLGGLGRRVVRNTTSRIVSRVVGLGIAALLAAVGLKNCGKTESREQIAEHSTKVVNVNTASVADLMLLPRVNDNLAQRIVAGRPYKSVDDLRRVSGIGPKTLDGLRDRVTVEAPPAK
jgi:DNA uptake protein ComE-like DNA-binding protein